MGWFALISLIISVIRLVKDLWPMISDALDGIDSLKSARDRKEARTRLARILHDHKEGKACAATCSGNLTAFVAELRNAS